MNTGGPAFPCRETGVDLRDEKGNVIGCRVFPPSQGMTLLDWMAGQALVAIPHIGCGSDLEPEQIAHDAYNFASAMLAEKARREEAMQSAFEKPGVATAMAVHEAFNKDHYRDASKMDQGQTTADSERWARFQDGIRIAFSPTGGWRAEIREGSMSYGDTVADAIANLRARWQERNAEPQSAVLDHYRDAETTLRRLCADVLPADIKNSANEQLPSWCAEQVRARVNTLEASNRELVEFAERIAAFPLEDFGWEKRADSQPLHGWNDYTLYVSDIKRARNLAAKAKGVA